MKTMIKWYVLFLILSLPLFSSGQIGINIKALLGKSKTLDTVGISQSGLQTSVEYNLRLKKKRIEFRPALGYRFTWKGPLTNGYFNSVDFDLNTAIYPFDFENDCHCPTFSKNGEMMKKGLFIEANPGIGYQKLSRIRANPHNPVELPIKSKNWVLKLGGSVGLDIGLSDQFTVTPMLTANYISSADWAGLNYDGSKGTLRDYISLGAGVRVTHHPDPRRRRH